MQTDLVGKKVKFIIDVRDDYGPPQRKTVNGTIRAVFASSIINEAYFLVDHPDGGFVNISATECTFMELGGLK